MRNVDRVTEHGAQQFGQRPGIAQVGIQLARRFCHQRRTLRAD
jgi:hypothetical protein